MCKRKAPISIDQQGLAPLQLSFRSVLVLENIVKVSVAIKRCFTEISTISVTEAIALVVNYRLSP